MAAAETKNFFKTVTLNDIYGDTGFSFWVPRYEERQFILRLASAVSEKDKPVVLDAACGNGFISKLLAADGQATVVGIDPFLEKMGYSKLGQSLGSVNFEEKDLWDVFGQYGPKYNSEIETSRKALLKAIKTDYLEQGPVYEYIEIGECLQDGDPLRLHDELAKLQELTRLYEEPGGVDLVICSFMPPGIDLTVPIRDGIFPKALIYTRVPWGGMVGAGDFYFEQRRTCCKSELGEDIPISSNTAISLNPGVNYHTAARWATTYENDWSDSRGELWDSLGAEVIIQLRNDVILCSSDPSPLERYSFDDEIEKGLRKMNRRSWRKDGRYIDEFAEGVLVAEHALFGSG